MLPGCRNIRSTGHLGKRTARLLVRLPAERLRACPVRARKFARFQQPRMQCASHRAIERPRVRTRRRDAGRRECRGVILWAAVRRCVSSPRKWPASPAKLQSRRPATPQGNARRQAGMEICGIVIAVEGDESCAAPETQSSMAMRASPIACNRCFGSFFRHRCNNPRIGAGVVAGNALHSGSARITAASVSVTVSPLKAILPVSISYSTQPNDQMSARRSTDLPLACSGAIYAAVPRIIPA